MTADLPEENESLWLLTASPVIWAAHFLLSYVTAAIWCAKVAGPDGSLGGVRVAIAVYTVLALSGIGIIGWSASAGTATAPPPCRTTTTRRRIGTASWGSPPCCCRP